jgi:ABC-type multidrug transport system fused ATPase/permease subunit
MKLFMVLNTINSRQRIKLLFATLLMAISALAEIVSIGSTLPFLAAVINPSSILDNEIFKILNNSIENKINLNNVIGTIAFLFIFAAATSTIIRIYVLNYVTKISYEIGHSISIKLLHTIINREYEKFIEIDYSDFLSTITQKVEIMIYYIILPGLTGVSSILMIIFLIIGLAIVDVNILIMLCTIFGLMYSVLILVVKKHLSINGKSINIATTEVLKNIRNIFVSMRDISLQGKHSVYEAEYAKINFGLRRSQASNQLFSGVPRYFVDFLGILFIAIITYYYSTDGDSLEKAIPMLGLIAISAQRMIPLFQQLYSAWASITGNIECLDSLLLYSKNNDIQNELNEEVNFENEIQIKDLYFNYNSSKLKIFENLNLKITKGSIVGIVGTSGSGKSTLIDIIMGLLTPKNGGIYVDGTLINKNNIKDWQSKFSHIPQDPYILNSTIINNITMMDNIEKIDTNKLVQSLKIAHIYDFVESLDYKLETILGDGGVQLSGGQKQRIAIARALYRDKQILILDEATSSLDHETERAFIDALHLSKKNVTLLIIAHRLETLIYCDEIYSINEGKLILNQLIV